MSTKARRLVPALGAAGLLAACAGSATPPPAGEGHFDQLRFGRTASPPPDLRPRLPAPPAVLPVTVESAAARVAAYLGRAGFTLEEQPEGSGRRFEATRMGAPSLLDAEATCTLQALHRPDISSTELTVRLRPEPGGVAVDSQARFVEVDTRIIAGALTRQTCRSRGVLEGAVRRAALGG